MWEIFAGHPPFDDRAHDHHLIFDICQKGLRPLILPNMPNDCTRMVQKCWGADPSKRTTIREILKFSWNKLKEIYEKENLKSNTERKEVTTSLFKRLFKFSKIKEKEKNIIDSNNNNNIISGNNNHDSPQQVYTTHPLAYH